MSKNLPFSSSASSQNRPAPQASQSVEVPRDLGDERDDAPSPAAGSVDRKDEDEAGIGKPQPEGSNVATALHEHPPQGRDQLRTGSGGDAARPGKEGIAGNPIPPRGRL
jgi:hypothetical protein